MSLKMENINYNDFKNICRICLFNCDLKIKSIQENNIIIGILKKLDVPYEINDELPQQICFNCFEKLNEIHEITLKCNEAYSSLIKCLNTMKKKQLEQVISETIVGIKIKEEITIEENEIKFDQVELNDIKLEVKEEICESNEEILTTLKRKKNHIAPKYKCDICQKTYVIRAAFEKHTRLHSGDHRYNCVQCSDSFLKKNSLMIHVRSHTLKRAYKCDICMKIFKTRANLVFHKHEHSGERRFKCDTCAISFFHQSQLNEHMLHVHSDARNFNYYDECPKEIKPNCTLRKRKKKRNNSELRFRCTICRKLFKRAKYLRDHKIVHKDENPNKCDICNKRFVNSNNLKHHQERLHKQHGGERLSECIICAAPFKYTPLLDAQKGGHNGERPYTCTFCNLKQDEISQEN